MAKWKKWALGIAIPVAPIIPALIYTIQTPRPPLPFLSSAKQLGSLTELLEPIGPGKVPGSVLTKSQAWIIRGYYGRPTQLGQTYLTSISMPMTSESSAWIYKGTVAQVAKHLGIPAPSEQKPVYHATVTTPDGKLATAWWRPDGQETCEVRITVTSPTTNLERASAFLQGGYFH